MRLLKYHACGGKPFRRLVVEDDGHFDVAVHPEIKAFGCVFTNVNVARVADNVVEFDLPEPSDWSVEMSDVFLSPEYKEQIGGHSPRIETMLDAHILKGRLPTLVQDFDAFVASLREQIEALGLDGVVYEHDKIKQTNLNVAYDLWMLYKYYLMLGNKVHVSKTDKDEISFTEDFVSEKGITWWLHEHNRQLMEMAVQHDLLAAYITFGTSSRFEREALYTFVTKEGTQMQRPTDPAEFMHMAVHGVFPEISLTERGSSYDLSCVYSQHFPKAYLDLQDAYNITVGHNFPLYLLRFI